MIPVVARSEASASLSVHTPAAGLRELFMPLDELLVRGGDPRLALDPVSGCNLYGCSPSPAPQLLCFASSTASPISERAYARAERAREQLMHAAIGLGLDEALDRRTEEMRHELRAHLQLAADVEIVFSPSGTDSQLHALALTRALLGERLTTIVVAADQTGSGTPATARGRHFNAQTASGVAVCKDSPIAGLACESIALPLCSDAELAPRAEHAQFVLDAVKAVSARGHAAMLQIMDSSKLGWRAPDQDCLDLIARRWPGRVQLVVDACQMRLGRRRLRGLLDRGAMVLITGSKFYGGPAFSGALLVPGMLSRALQRCGAVADGLFDYIGRSDWPMTWTSLRARSVARPNLGQWLRWEAALEEIAAYHQVPNGFRAFALRELGQAIENRLIRSSFLRPVITERRGADDEEFARPTIFPFALLRDSRLLAANDVQQVHRALRRHMSGVIGGTDDRAIASQHCLVGQPVRVERSAAAPTALLRLCIGARQVIETWNSDAAVARDNLAREIGRLTDVVAKIELLASHVGSLDSRKV
ncbi:hypothetical protein [Bradyrhizobium sp. STM 3557]|uniref:hypothetical protein n=1 Tax=Bradyrhizobium sp. STM 3557 TaxID=578920 RepID=UPI00388FE223